ncbi:MAG: class I adenylate-forming enzyme family protein [Caulobacterales bacterium]
MIAELIFDWARKTPDRTAIVVNGQPCSYRSFAEFIAVARGFFARRDCVGPGVAVVASHHLVDFWVISAALRSLGLTTIAAQSVEAIGQLGLPGLRFVVTTVGENWEGLEQLCATKGLRLLKMDPEGEAPLDLDAAAPCQPGGHILQTSGTTGVYKNVLIDPSFEPEFTRRRVHDSGVTRDSVVNLFGMGGWTGGGYKSAVAVWWVGATAVIDQRSVRHLALLYPGITHALLTPAMLDAILAAPEGSFPRNPAMRLNVTGGTLTQTQIDAAKARITPQLYNGLGATETSTFGYTPLDTPDDHRWHLLVPGVAVEIVDDFDQPLPRGELGRVRVSTKGGPTSYLHDEEATRAFFKDGFFYPGDLGVIRADGRMALHGRFTDVINMNGLKISPAPVEDRLREALGVRGVCLLSMQNERGEEEIHVIIESRIPIDSRELSAALRLELSGFPQGHVHYVPALPRNSMGKLLRLAAREQAVARMAAAG